MPPASRPADSVARVGRLTLKELRETLRDRRTIVTLVADAAAGLSAAEPGVQAVPAVELSARGPTRSGASACQRARKRPSLMAAAAARRRAARRKRRPHSPASDDARRRRPACCAGRPGLRSRASDRDLAIFNSAATWSDAVRAASIDLAVRVRSPPASEPAARAGGRMAPRFRARSIGPTPAQPAGAPTTSSGGCGPSTSDYARSRLAQLGDRGDVAGRLAAAAARRAGSGHSFWLAHAGAAGPDPDDDHRRGLSGHRPDRRRARAGHARSPDGRAGAAAGPAVGQVHRRADRRDAHGPGEPRRP